ncbi:MAG: PAS domain S-box protein [Bacteroidetes bacterium]|nr:PAS domain S-box protein [Bacteroidota bacterium]
MISRKPLKEIKIIESVLKIVSARAAAEIERDETIKDLQIAENKFRSIFENATEGIFQTTEDGKVITINPAMARMLGYDSTEEFIDKITNIPKQIYVSPENRQELKRLLRVNKKVTGFETEFYRKDGSKIWVSFNIHEVCDDKGNLLYYEGTDQDITDRKKAEEENQLLLTFTKTVSEAEDFDSALTSALKMVCECTAWEYGEAWIPDSDRKYLKLSSSWFTKVKNVESFRRASERFTFAPGVGLPGRVWKSKKPAWIPDVTIDANFLRAPFAKEIGFKAAVGIPILTENDVVTVIVFFLRELRQEDERMISLVSAIAEELGMLFQRKRIQEKLRKKAEHHRAVIESIFKFVPEGLLVFSENLNLLKQNKAFEDIIQKYAAQLGYTEQELAQKIIEQLRIKITGSDTSEIHISKNDKSRGVSPQADQTDEIVIEFNHSRMFLAEEEEEEEASIVVSLKDITERKKSEESLKMLSTAVEQSAEAILISDRSGKIEFVNDSFCKLTRYSRNEAIGQKPSILKSGDHDREFYAEIWETIMSGNTYRGIIINKKKNGEKYFSSQTMKPIVDSKGEIIKFLSVQNDLTERIKNEEELKAAKEKAEEMNRLKDNFLANMSHEFRTPMNAILGFSDILMEELRNSDQEVLYEFSKSLNNGGRRLLNLLNDVLDISQIEANKMFLNVETGFLVNAVEPVMSVLSILAKEKNLEMTTVINSKRKVYFDAQRFEQVLINIVGNAIRFTERGKITIEVDEGANEKNEPCGIVRVIDTGRGISKEFLPKVFDEFRQESEGHSRSHEGSGLGLTISKRLLNLMNAR